MVGKVFPFKQPGDSLTAQHINDLSDLVSQLSSGARNSHTRANYAVPGVANGVLPFSVVHLQINQDNLDGTYDCYLRYYDFDNGSWKTDELIEHLLDGTQSGQNFTVGTYVAAYYHAQRGAYMPLTASTGPLLKVGKAVDLIVPLDIGEVRIWRDGSKTEEIIENVQHDWITGDQAVEKDAEVIIGYFSDEGVWRIIGAECPPE